MTVEGAVGGLLVLLDEGTAAAAPGLEQIHGEVALKVVLSADIATLDHHRDAVHAETGGNPEAEALEREQSVSCHTSPDRRRAGRMSEKQEDTYGRVDGVVAFHRRALAGTMVSLAEGDTWRKASDGTCPSR